MPVTLFPKTIQVYLIEVCCCTCRDSCLKRASSVRLGYGEAVNLLAISDQVALRYGKERGP